jgi:hypothetical protein
LNFPEKLEGVVKYYSNFERISYEVPPDITRVMSIPANSYVLIPHDPTKPPQIINQVGEPPIPTIRTPVINSDLYYIYDDDDFDSDRDLQYDDNINSD